MKRLLKICNEQGMHMRPSSMIVSTVENFDGEVIFVFKQKKANAKNIIELMFLELCKDDEFEVHISSNKKDTDCENELFENLLNLIEQKFGEN